MANKISEYVDTYKAQEQSDGSRIYMEYWKDGGCRPVDYNQDDFVQWRIEKGINVKIVPYVAPVDTRTDEEKRLAEYQTKLDPILSKIQFYAMEYELEDEVIRKLEIKNDILDVLKADWKAKKKAIRDKYPTGLWKPTVRGES